MSRSWRGCCSPSARSSPLGSCATPVGPAEGSALPGERSRRASDDVDKGCHIEGHQKVCPAPPGPKHWPEVLDSKSEVHLITGHRTQKNYLLSTLYAFATISCSSSLCSFDLELTRTEDYNSVSCFSFLSISHPVISFGLPW